MDATSNMENEKELKEESKSRLWTRREFLVQFHNAHLRQFIADVINLKTFETANDSEVFAIVPVQVPGSNQVTQRKVTIKEQKVIVTNQLKQQQMLLSTMEMLLSEEGVEIPEDAKAKNIAKVAYA